jgi:hypothetical protein
MKSLTFLIFITAAAFSVSAQDCTATVSYLLKNTKGGFYANQTVSLYSKDGKKIAEKKSDANGVASFEVPCESKFDLKISNYSRTEDVFSGKNGTHLRMQFSYEPNMIETDKRMALTDAEKATIDKAVSALPDTSIIVPGLLNTPTSKGSFDLVTIILKDLNDVPLANESFVISALKRKKHFKGKASAAGVIKLYLPKNDDYEVNFKYHTNYRKFDVASLRGEGTMRMEITYMGTKEYLKRKKEEEERIRREEIRLKEERIAFEKYCKERSLSLAEGFKSKMKEENPMFRDDVILKVLNRNNWSEKLIVCDLTGSMDPYAQQLAVWYQLNIKNEPNLQFVFFNDGDNKSDDRKVIGETGGIYTQTAKGLDSLINIMSLVRSKGDGGDCAENNMEALIKGVKRSKPYKELVMIVDNNAPVKDIKLLSQFTKPVHIILCGSENGEVLLDYLLIAWKTKGSIHTIEQDITKIASMSEGQTLQIGSLTYKILGGQFVRITKS